MNAMKSLPKIEGYFASMAAHLTLIPAELFWNADEPLMSSVKHMSPPDVNVATEIKQGSVTLAII
jgi:hypothetical protein